MARQKSFKTVKMNGPSGKKEDVAENVSQRLADDPESGYSFPSKSSKPEKSELDKYQ